MKPYQTYSLTDFPDVGDILAEGSKTSVGRLPRRSGDYRGYGSPKFRKKARRYLKRSDKDRSRRSWIQDLVNKIGVWLSLVEHTVRDREVGGSALQATNLSPRPFAGVVQR